MLIDGRIVYSRAGWIEAALPGTCALCGADVPAGARIIRVAAHTHGGNWASTCCAARAEDLSGHWLLRPNAPRES